MARSYERSFVVEAPVERVWRAFSVPEELNVWHGTAEVFEPVEGGRVRFADPGHAPVEGTVEAAVPHRRLRWRVDADQSVIEETFEEVNGGTRVTITHESEDQEWPDYELEAITLGWNESIADLVFYLERGVRFTRHMTARSLIGATTRNAMAGVEVVSVRSGTFADNVGLEPGDVLLQLGEAPIFDRSDLALIMREHEPGVELEAVFARGGRIVRSAARLSPRD
jgi:uncharacterized protein YndB with AHSA1/START domain